jgi:hypothetical protein
MTPWARHGAGTVYTNLRLRRPPAAAGRGRAGGGALRLVRLASAACASENSGTIQRAYRVNAEGTGENLERAACTQSDRRILCTRRAPARTGGGGGAFLGAGGGFGASWMMPQCQRRASVMVMP